MIEGDYPSYGYKYLTAERLIDLLKQLPAQARIVVNPATRNLTVVLVDDGKRGMIDFLMTGEVIIYD